MVRITVQVALAEPPVALALSLPEDWGSRSLERGVIRPVLKKKRGTAGLEGVGVEDVELALAGARLAPAQLVRDVDWGPSAVVVLRRKGDPPSAAAPPTAPQQSAPPPKPPKPPPKPPPPLVRGRHAPWSSPK